MELATVVHGLSLDATLGDRTMTLNPVAVESPRGLLLLDVGLPNGVADLAHAIADEGRWLEEAWAVVITHQDLDHAGCLAAVVERTDATTFAHAADAPYLEGELELAKSSEERPMAIEPTRIDVRLAGGESFATAAGPMTAVYTPGHAPGHTSFYFPEAKLLVAGDACNVVDGELVGPRESATPDLETAWDSVETLAGLDVERTVCYHGGAVDAGTERLEALVAERDASA